MTSSAASRDLLSTNWLRFMFCNRAASASIAFWLDEARIFRISPLGSERIEFSDTWILPHCHDDVHTQWFQRMPSLSVTSRVAASANELLLRDDEVCVPSKTVSFTAYGNPPRHVARTRRNRRSHRVASPQRRRRSPLLSRI